MAYQRGFKADAERLALEMRSELGAGSYDSTRPNLRHTWTSRFALCLT